MELYLTKNNISGSKNIVVDDMFLTTDMPTTAGSKMLDGYKSLFEAEVISKLKNAGYTISGKANVGEFGIDILGETSYFGRIENDGIIKNACAEIVKTNEALAAISVDINGSVRRASNSGVCSIKPTYGIVSRYGTIPVACSGETVSVMSKNVETCLEVLNSISGHDNKDGTSIPDEMRKNAKVNLQKHGKVAVLSTFLNEINDDLKSNLDNICDTLKANGIEVAIIDDKSIHLSRPAWNILMSAELCNNVSRYDGVKYGFRSNNFTNIDELYTNSRTEAFGDLLKYAIIFGSETLSTDNYMKVYDKALRVRRVISEEFESIFNEYDAVLIPAGSSLTYTTNQIQSDKFISFKENLYTAPASITGLPAVTISGVQFIGKAFSEEIISSLAKICEKEDK